MSEAPRLILASASPRRRELLAGIGLEFRVQPVDIDETPHPGESAEAYVSRLADEKAAARDGHRPGDLILAADTIVVLEGRLLGKPDGPEEARAMLAQLAGREHIVKTALALREVGAGQDRWARGIATTAVRLAELSEEEIAWYVESEEPLDKAGSYGIQGLGALFVESIRGNYTNVVGLPLPLLSRLLGQLGYDLAGGRGEETSSP